MKLRKAVSACSLRHQRGVTLRRVTQSKGKGQVGRSYRDGRLAGDKPLQGRVDRHIHRYRELLRVGGVGQHRSECMCHTKLQT